MLQPAERFNEWFGKFKWDVKIIVGLSYFEAWFWKFI